MVLLAALTLPGCAGSPSVQPPPVPHSVTLDWTASTSTVIGYNVYRGTQDGGPYTPLNSSLVTTTQYKDSSVQSGHTYFYVVTAVDSSQVESANSNQVSATIPNP
ncbi:MAG TPA: fibronectin type III domain-containing protein [Candidatus Acidoferrum sp.]